MEPARALFSYRRRLQWGDGDAARIGYTSSQLDIFLEAVDDWWRQIVGIDWYELNTVRGLGSPCVHVELDFHSPVRPGEVVDVRVRLAQLGRSSMRFELEAFDPDGRKAFSATLVHVLINGEQMRSEPIPEDLAAPMREYRARTQG